MHVHDDRMDMQRARQLETRLRQRDAHLNNHVHHCKGHLLCSLQIWPHIYFLMINYVFFSLVLADPGYVNVKRASVHGGHSCRSKVNDRIVFCIKVTVDLCSDKNDFRHMQDNIFLQ